MAREKLLESAAEHANKKVKPVEKVPEPRATKDIYRIHPEHSRSRAGLKFDEVRPREKPSILSETLYVSKNGPGRADEKMPLPHLTRLAQKISHPETSSMQ